MEVSGRAFYLVTWRPTVPTPQLECRTTISRVPYKRVKGKRYSHVVETHGVHLGPDGGAEESSEGDSSGAEREMHGVVESSGCSEN